MAKQRLVVFPGATPLSITPPPLPLKGSQQGQAPREQAFPSDLPAEGLHRQAHITHHSLCDYRNLDPEDPSLFAGRHSLQAELPTRELDGKFHFDLQ